MITAIALASGNALIRPSLSNFLLEQKGQAFRHAGGACRQIV